MTQAAFWPLSASFFAASADCDVAGCGLVDCADAVVWIGIGAQLGKQVVEGVAIVVSANTVDANTVSRRGQSFNEVAGGFTRVKQIRRQVVKMIGIV